MKTVSRMSGLARSTIQCGLAEPRDAAGEDAERVRRAGGGRIGFTASGTTQSLQGRHNGAAICQQALIAETRQTGDDSARM
jgi:hypothetical protein